MLRIGNVTISPPVLLAPMSGVTDASYRILCREMGCGFVYTEMVQSNILHYNYDRALPSITVDEREKPVGIQLYGNDPRLLASAVERLEQRADFALYDINMGCPMTKIMKRGCGAAMMRRPALAAEIVRTLKAVTRKPVTAKFRMGIDETTVNAVPFAQELEQAGVDAVTVHGRTARQLYAGKADWDIIRQVKDAVKVPVIGNGSVFSAADAQELLRVARCDGVMVSRGGICNPWIFRQIRDALEGRPVTLPGDRERMAMCLRQYARAVELYGEWKGVHEMRKHVAWYTKGMPNAVELRRRVYGEPSSAAVIRMLEEFRDALAG